MQHGSLRFAGAVALALSAVASLRLAPPLAAATSPCDISGVERIVAIGDVHGAYDRFVEILRATGLVDDRLRWSGGKTHLIQLGDVVDRGTDSRKALDLLRRLSEAAAREGGAVYPLLGNHEVMRLLGDLRFVTAGEYEAFVTQDSARTRDKYIQNTTDLDRDELLKKTPLGLVEMRLAFGRQGTYGQWLRTLNVVVKIDGILFLHGGISPAVAGLSCDTINATVRRELTADFDKTRAEPLGSLAAREDGPLWYRGLAQEPDTSAPQVDDTLAKQRAQALVIAHTVAPDGRIRVRFGGKVLQIDTGMQAAYVPDGRASALEIRGGVFTAIYQDRKDVLLSTRVDPARQ